MRPRMATATAATAGRAVAGCLVLAAAAGNTVAAQTPAPDVIFEPTPRRSVEAMLAAVDVGPGDVVYDLGSGDGRIVVTAARLYGARGVGVDIDPARVEEGRELARRHDVDDLVRFVQGDLFETDVSEASVVALYLLDELNVRLRPRLVEQLRPGSRVVSYRFTMGDWEPDVVTRAGDRNIYLWVVPAPVDGRWELRTPGGERIILDLLQRYQRLAGTATRHGRRSPILGGRVEGGAVHLDTADGSLEARVDGDSIVLLAGHGGQIARGRRTGGPVVTP